MAKRLIINADDFGSSNPVNEAVARTNKKGILTSATIMTNMPAAKEAVEIAKGLPKLGVGVHLNLFRGKPLSRGSIIECLTDSDGNFRYSPKLLAAMAMTLHGIRKAIKIELAKQIQWLIDRGIKPTHLDSHKHFHCFVPVYSIVCDLARQFKIDAVRWCYEPQGLGNTPWPLSSSEGRNTARWIRRMAGINRMQNKKLIKTESFIGMTHIGRVDLSFLKAVSLYNRASVAELMTHPATEDDPENPYRTAVLARKTELEALCDERAKRYFADAGIELVHYGQL